MGPAPHTPGARFQPTREPDSSETSRRSAIVTAAERATQRESADLRGLFSCGLGHIGRLAGGHIPFHRIDGRLFLLRVSRLSGASRRRPKSPDSLFPQVSQSASPLRRDRPLRRHVSAV